MIYGISRGNKKRQQEQTEILKEQNAMLKKQNKTKTKYSKKVKRIRNNLNRFNKQNRIEELKKTLIDVRKF